MRYAVIENDIVSNVIVLENINDWHGMQEVVSSEEASPGWTYKNGVFINPIPTPATDSTGGAEDLSHEDKLDVIMAILLANPSIKIPDEVKEVVQEWQGDTPPP